MSRRWRAGLSLLFLGSVLALPAVHWRLIGWARGEVFHAGRPTSYWKSYIHECEFVHSPAPYFFAPEPSRFHAWLLDTLNIRSNPHPVLLTDPDALPLLLDLLDQDDWKVQLFALQSIAGLGPAAQLVPRPKLRTLAKTTPDYLVYRQATLTLWAIDGTTRELNLLSPADEYELRDRYYESFRNR